MEFSFQNRLYNFSKTEVYCRYLLLRKANKQTLSNWEREINLIKECCCPNLRKVNCSTLLSEKKLKDFWKDFICYKRPFQKKVFYRFLTTRVKTKSKRFCFLLKCIFDFVFCFFHLVDLRNESSFQLNLIFEFVNLKS